VLRVATRSVSPQTMNYAEREHSKLDVGNYPLLLINDAIQRESSMYYVNADDQVDSIWDSGDDARASALLFRNPTVSATLSALALCDMFLAVTGSPGIPGAGNWLRNLSTALHIMIWLVFVGVSLTRLKYMWKARGMWFGGAIEPPWVVIQAVVVFIIVPIEMIQGTIEGTSEMTQEGGEVIYCPAAFSIFLQGWCRAWVYIYFNKGIRDALMTLIKVFTCLGPLTALLLVSFFAHFFIFQGLTVGVTAPQEGFGVAGNVSDALYNLFGLLTTVNHPDALMWLVDAKPSAFLFIISFMFFTSIIGLNLLLAIVYGEYVGILATELETKALLRSKMLDTAFDLLCPVGRDYLTPTELVDIMRRCNDVEEPAVLDDKDRNELIVRMIDNKALNVEDNDDEFDNAQDHKIDRKDMKELIVFATVPLHIKSTNKPEFRMLQAIKDKKRVLAETKDPHLREQYTHQIEDMEDMPLHEWCATYPGVYKFILVNGSDAHFMGWLNPWNDRSFFKQIHNAWFLFYLFYCIFTVAHNTVTVSDSALLFLSAFYQLFYVLFGIIAEMRRWQAAHYFNPNSKTILSNATNFGLLVCLWIEFADNCANNKCMDDFDRSKSGNGAVIFSAFSKFFLTANFAVETTTVFVLVRAVFKTIPTLGPHFGLFFAIYNGFAGMGISFFCGLLMQSNADGGPGFWGQKGAVTGTSPATGTPWSQTAYGSAEYYYNLNYNGFAQAIMSLYVVMIQNNWNTAADGPVQVTHSNYRWFFVIFTIMVAFVMMNVLVGAIIDALNGVREEMVREANGEKDPLEIVCQKRIDATKGPSGAYYGDTWELGDVELYGEVRYDAELCSIFSTDEPAEHAAATEALLTRKAELESAIARLKAANGGGGTNPNAAGSIII